MKKMNPNDAKKKLGRLTVSGVQIQGGEVQSLQ